MYTIWMHVRGLDISPTFSKTLSQTLWRGWL